jgi:DNA-binding protein HU-beta
MNKVELVGAVASKSEISKKDVEKVINAFTNIVADALVDGDKVQLVGFGTFEVVERAERQGRNPATGEAITIAASKSPKFKAGKALKDAVKA